ncbi:hypothetical protein LRAMOSA04779 [Lichtheimia ramosa]|uniref:Ubiquitin-like modifier-activating enzyme ATG7 n=1 Tax=Lichtheimia ramosa TaxID=688394 RepID=A0A077X065_9FUNG|nr:hypothetical protein LRAMOSA04779 [Lichtheimia ramosa]
MTNQHSPVLQFAPFASGVDASFWQALASKKLNVLKLSDDPQPIHAYYATGSASRSETPFPPHFSVSAQGLDSNNDTRPPFTFGVTGTLYNTNTFEEFKRIDKNKLFHQASQKIWQAIQSGMALDQPSVLTEFIMVTFADLKRYKFYYWFAFPALMPQPDPWLTSGATSYPIGDTYSQDEIKTLSQAYQASGRPSCFFVRNKVEIIHLNQGWHDDLLVGFADPSSTELPGWPLRNLLALLHKHYGIFKCKVLCYREIPGKGINDTRLLEAELPTTAYYHDKEPKAVGWERNVQGKLAPRMADLGPLMDPLRLADTSVDLNLKLMRWRVMPELDLDKIKNTRCLLLGAGTLGCYVARCLVGWGVRNITFVDNGRVSFSNPVRQPLYQFNDCLEGGSPKAETAAKNLKQVQPTVNSAGHALSIPMPGHVATSDIQLEEDIHHLEELVNEHDAVFLLTDSRESRWFPTLLCARANKLVINAALGFDTYLVMRHGSRRHGLDNPLGCYFCNDVVAPADSLSDRTLDQQCTVTRPGLAAIAGALAVELLVSLIQHPKGIEADSDCILGSVPHQIRGFLGQFHNMLIVGQAYNSCTGCSQKIIEAYDKEPLEFMKKVLSEPEYLEEISGIAKLKADSDAMLDHDWEEDDF